LTTEMHSHTAV